MRQAFESMLEPGQAGIQMEEPEHLPVDVPSENSLLLELPPAPAIPGVTVGILAGFDVTGAPLVTFAENQEGAPLPARSTVGLSVRQIGYELALVFEQGDLAKPIILGCIRHRSSTQLEDGPAATLDGEQIVLSAEREIVLRCGKSSITLTRAGKVIIRGAYLLSRSSGVNRIKGGSVHIN